MSTNQPKETPKQQSSKFSPLSSEATAFLNRSISKGRLTKSTPNLFPISSQDLEDDITDSMEDVSSSALLERINSLNDDHTREGLDWSWVLNSPRIKELRARLEAPQSDRIQMETTGVKRDADATNLNDSNIEAKKSRAARLPRNAAAAKAGKETMELQFKRIAEDAIAYPGKKEDIEKRRRFSKTIVPAVATTSKQSAAKDQPAFRTRRSERVTIDETAIPVRPTKVDQSKAEEIVYATASEDVVESTYSRKRSRSRESIASIGKKSSHEAGNVHYSKQPSKKISISDEEEFISFIEAAQTEEEKDETMHPRTFSPRKNVFTSDSTPIPQRPTSALRDDDFGPTILRHPTEAPVEVRANDQESNPRSPALDSAIEAAAKAAEIPEAVTEVIEVVEIEEEEIKEDDGISEVLRPVRVHPYAMHYINYAQARGWVNYGGSLANAFPVAKIQALEYFDWMVGRVRGGDINWVVMKMCMEGMHQMHIVLNMDWSMVWFDRRVEEIKQKVQDGLNKEARKRDDLELSRRIQAAAMANANNANNPWNMSANHSMILQRQQQHMQMQIEQEAAQQREIAPGV